MLALKATALRSALRVNPRWNTLQSASISTTRRWDAPTGSSTDGTMKRMSESEKRARAVEFSLLVPGLTTFHRATGHFLVPFHFPIPHKSEVEESGRNLSVMERVVGTTDVDWPDALRGLNLGRVLHKFMMNKHYHERYPLVVAELRDIGFPVDVDWKMYLWRKLTFMSLKTFHRLEGHSIVPTDFVVPHGDERWPRQSWGFRLGARVHRLRQTSDSLEPHEIEDLQQLDFSFDVAETTWSDKILPSLQVFKQVYGHCDVKTNFVVPSEEPWPEKAWATPLGSLVSSIRGKDGYAKQVKRDAELLDEIQFVWSHREAAWKEVVLPSLEAFYHEYGHSRVGREFVVPSTAPWSKLAWGFNLGVSVNHIRNAGTYAKEIASDLERVNAINFVWGLREFRWRECILPSLEVFADQYKHCRIPRDFVVPAQAPWPEEAWKMKLGVHVHDIKYVGTYSNFVLEDAEHLRAIGFWETLPSPPTKPEDYW